MCVTSTRPVEIWPLHVVLSSRFLEGINRNGPEMVLRITTSHAAKHHSNNVTPLLTQWPLFAQCLRPEVLSLSLLTQSNPLYKFAQSRVRSPRTLETVFESRTYTQQPELSSIMADNMTHRIDRTLSSHIHHARSPNNDCDYIYPSYDVIYLSTCNLGTR